MSRAIVVQPGIFERFVKKMRATVSSIKNAGFPQLGIHEITPFPSDKLNAVDVLTYNDIAVPLFVFDNLMISADGIPINGAIRSVAAADQGVSVNNDVKPAIKIEVEIEADNIVTKNNEKAEKDHAMAKDVIISSLKNNNIIVESADNIGTGVTRITLDNLSHKNDIKIPEYVFVKR